MQISNVRISNNNTHKSPFFTAKNKDSRKADDIMRNTKRVFNFIPSSSYAAMFYKSLDNPDERKLKLIASIYGKNYKYVKEASFGETGEDNPTEKNVSDMMEYIRRMDETKFANCGELAYATYCGMIANKYNAIGAALGIIVEVKDKKTGEIIQDKGHDLDHSAVLTNMGNQKRREYNDLIVVDPWLNFAGSISKAYGEYIRIFFDSKIKKIINNISLEIKEETEKKGETFNPKNYELSSQLLFSPILIFKKETRDELRKKLLETYPELELKY